MKAQLIGIYLGSETVFYGERILSTSNGILSFEDIRSLYWRYQGQLLKIIIGSDSNKSIEHGYFNDGRTEGSTVSFKLIS